MRRVIVTPTFVTGLGVVVASLSLSEDAQPPAGWKLVWSDEFDGKEIDKTKWDFDIGNGFFSYEANTWVGMLTGQKHMSDMATVGGVIPNTTSLLGLGTGLNQVFFGAAKNSRFVPNSKNWASVENANVLPDMLVKIFTKQQTIPDATGSASSRITSLLNGGG